MAKVISKIDNISNLPAKDLGRVQITNGAYPDDAIIGSITVTSDGNPIKISLDRRISDPFTTARITFSSTIDPLDSGGRFEVKKSSNGGPQVTLGFTNFASGIYSASSTLPAISVNSGANNFFIIDHTPDTGTITYSFVFQDNSDTVGCTITNVDLIASRL